MKWTFPDKKQVEVKDLTTKQLKDILKLLNEFYANEVAKVKKPHDFSALEGMKALLFTADGFECLQAMTEELRTRKDK